MAAQLTKEQQIAFLRMWHFRRQRGRTDLLWLSQEVLRYKDIDPVVHGPIIDSLQKFKGGEDGPKGYVPFVTCWELEGPRERMVLDPRGFFKTTITDIAHTIQWIINYPDIRVLLSMATGNQVTAVMSELLNHFRFNEHFRFLYPDFCPNARSSKDFGNMEGFTVPNRGRKWLKEPTVSSCSVGRVVAGGHYEVIKHGDLVDKENVKTPNQVREVNEHFQYMNPLLERGPIAPYRGWTDIDGTIYDEADLYSVIMRREESLPTEKRTWQISIRDAEVGANGKHMDEPGGTTLFPTRFPKVELERIRAEVGDYIYSCQYRLKPIPSQSALATRDEVKFVARKIMRSVPMHYHMTVDLAGMDPQSNGDFTVLNIHAYDNDGRLNIVEVLAGRYDPFMVIDLLFLQCKAIPQIRDIKIEREAHSRVLGPFIKREQQKRGVFLPPIIEIKRDNRTAKKQRIKGLQPWFKGGIIRFAEEITAKLETIQQILRFSDTSTYHDDILDTLADAMQNRDGGIISDVFPDAERGYIAPKIGQFSGFDPISHQPMWGGDTTTAFPSVDPRTGM